LLPAPAAESEIPGPVCQSTIARYVWSGDQILWELRAPGAAGDNLEATNGNAVPNHTIRFGRVSYLHAGGIDRPLTITKDAQEPIIPHQNWRGTFAWGTWGKGTYKGYRSDCVSGGPSTCVNVAWPGWQTNAWHEDGNPGEQEYWMGSLADGMRDMSGQIYMRNRYYDPATGQFTQTDPIGLAGGLNAYGFAAGDPVSYDDPYGLCPPIHSCLRGNGPKTAITIGEFRAGRREHFTFPIDIVVTGTKDTMIRGGFNDAGEQVYFMQGGLRLDTDLLPDGADKVPVTLAAVNADTGEFDVFGRIGPNLMALYASGNFKKGTFQGRVCILGVCKSDSSDSEDKQSSPEIEEHNSRVWCGKVGCE
jgi:RHS repeat-associated protein